MSRRLLSNIHAGDINDDDQKLFDVILNSRIHTCDYTASFVKTHLSAPRYCTDPSLVYETALVMKHFNFCD